MRQTKPLMTHRTRGRFSVRGLACRRRTERARAQVEHPHHLLRHLPGPLVVAAGAGGGARHAHGHAGALAVHVGGPLGVVEGRREGNHPARARREGRHLGVLELLILLRERLRERVERTDGRRATNAQARTRQEAVCRQPGGSRACMNAPDPSPSAAPAAPASSCRRPGRRPSRASRRRGGGSRAQPRGRRSSTAAALRRGGGGGRPPSRSQPGRAAGGAPARGHASDTDGQMRGSRSRGGSAAAASAEASTGVMSTPRHARECHKSSRRDSSHPDVL